MSTCQLCDLPTPESPVTASDVDGGFCCRGCLEVARTLEDDSTVGGMDETDAVTQDDGETDVPDDAATAYLAVDGMHCTTCESFLSLRGEDTEGIHAVEANYGMETARVVYNPDHHDEADLSGLLSAHGYRFRQPEADAANSRARQRDTAQRLVVGGFLSMLVMPWYFVYLYPSYVGIETGILDVDATTTATLYVPMAILALATAGVLFYTGGPVLRGAWVSLTARQPNMDLLVAVAACGAFAYSTVALATGSIHLYYDVTVAIVMIVTLGRYYEGAIRSQATARLSELTTARTSKATRLTDDGRETVGVEELSAGDEVVVAPGERVPVDGTVCEGVADVDESVVTGEAMPVTKAPGEAVVGGAVVTDDALVVEVGPAVESTAERIATALWRIQSATPGIQRLADAIATVFVPLVLVLGTAVTLWQLAAGSSVATAMLLGLVVLVVSCPCAMGLATPLAVSAGLRDGLEQGVIIANESVFEVAPEADTVVFDKTGTLTTGEMTVSEVVGADETLRYAAAVERLASHPVADAILDAADGNAVTDGGTAVLTEGVPEVAGFTRHPGDGVTGVVDGREVAVGTPAFVADRAGPIPATLRAEIDAAEREGNQAVAVGWEGHTRGVIAVGDSARREWEQAIEAFDDHEIAVLTGDDGPGAERFREHPAVDSVFAGVPPDGKVETVRRLSATGTTVMVGDGTNDAPALAAADLGIAMGDGTARAIEAADAVVTDNDLTAVETVFSFVRGTRRRIRENIAWAFLYNAVAIPLAVAGLLNPLFAALAMAASSLIVVSNSRRSVL
ncbi:heavy metal translocating P-type ATPase [Halovenus salina]|uniref:Heavy metal translocating P-type ATPase n=1 Tax=Halovenus salina TaxID=1510225 RepID=A0ABD5W4B2_9EURY|nr:cation-translocating P-type ATPase [Halovenus salina]